MQGAKQRLALQQKVLSSGHALQYQLRERYFISLFSNTVSTPDPVRGLQKDLLSFFLPSFLLWTASYYIVPMLAWNWQLSPTSAISRIWDYTYEPPNPALHDQL